MLASFCSWWIARMSELLPASWTQAGAGAADGIIVQVDGTGTFTTLVRHNNREQPITLGIAARLAASKPVIVRPPPQVVLEKHHVVPTVPRRELNQLLRYELARITPFKAEDLFWKWDSRPKPGERSRTEVILTMVPKIAVALALETAANAGIQPRFLEVGPVDRPRLLAIETGAGRSTSHRLVYALSLACAGLAVIALLLPLLLQQRAISATNASIDELQPTMRRIEALRRGITADDAGRTVLAQEMERTGDILQVLATVTRILPDDTYLTDFALRERQMTLSGRSAAAARLITSLSADPAIRDAAFAAPVTRIEGATTDVFSIRAGIVSGVAQ